MTWSRLGVLLIAAGVSCASDTRPPDGWLERIGRAPRPPMGDNWPLPPAQVETLMATGAGEVRDREELATGVTNADRFTIHYPKIGRTIDLKWKAAPPGDADGWNNAPRKELAAYALQKWFLTPDAYVVPTTVARCIRLDTYRNLDPEAEPTLPGTDCVFGVQAMWLEDVEVPDRLYEESRFYREPDYARHLANFNLFTYLIEDRDTRDGNVLTSEARHNRRVFSVDNGISFDPKLYNIFINDWQEILVPALPRDSIERLRKVTPQRAHELGVVAQFETDSEGMLRPAKPTAPIDPSRGVRFRDGVLQLGLTDAEIEQLLERVRALLARIDRGEIPLF